MPKLNITDSCSLDGELLVSYWASNELLDDGVYVKITSVEVVIAGVGVPLSLSAKQIDHLENEIAEKILVNYE
jgi:hypothetical protein